MLRGLGLLVLFVAVGGGLFMTLPPETKKRVLTFAVFYSNVLYYDTIGIAELNNRPNGATPYTAAFAEMLKSKSSAFSLPLNVELLRKSVDNLGFMTPTASNTKLTPVTFVDKTSGRPVHAVWTDVASAQSPRSLPHILYLHGGSFIAGGSASHAGYLSRLVHSVGARGFLLDYERFPENSLDNILSEVVAAYEYLLANQVPAHRIVVVGDSAGGSLATMLIRELVQRDIASPAGVVLISPWLDFQGALPSHTANEKWDFLTRIFLKHVANQLAENKLEKITHWSSVLLNTTDFGGFPHFFIFVSNSEILHDDSAIFARTMHLSKHAVTLIEGFDLPHNYPLYPDFLPPAAEALQQITRFVQEKTDRS